MRADPLTATPDATAPLGANPGDLGDPGADATGWESSPTPWAAPTLPSPPQPSAAAARRRLVGPLVLGTLLGWAGVAWLLGVAVTTGLAVALVIIGGGIVMGGSRLLIVPALLIGGALGMAAVVDIPLSGPVGQQVWAPLSVADVDSPYELSVGEGTLDLSAIDLPAGERLTVDASVGIGQLVVLVPSDLALDVDTNVGLGDSQVLDIHREGVGLSTDQFDEQGAVGGTLVLHLQAGIGQIEVRRAGPLVDRGTTLTTVMR